MKKISLVQFLLFLIIQLPGIITYGQLAIPYINNFNSLNTGWTSTYINSNSIWEITNPTYAPTNSNHSAPFCWDINRNQAYGNNAEAVLTSPLFQLDNSSYQLLSFWQNCFTESGKDGTRLEYSLAGGPWLTLGTAGDPNAVHWYTTAGLNSTTVPAWEGNSNGWIRSSYKITGMNNQQIQFRFVFTSNANTTSAGISIDDFSLLPAPATELGVADIAINQPLITGTTSDSISVTIINNGTNPASQFDVYYTYNGFTSTIVYTDTLFPGNNVTVKLPGLSAVPTGILCGNVFIAGDADVTNNYICDSLYGVFYVPYTNNFDSASTGWSTPVNSLGSEWELGSPAYGQTNSTHSGTNCWDINLNGTYNSSSYSLLESPAFLLGPSSCHILSFWHNFNVESNFDGMQIEYSIAGGTWQRLGNYLDNNATNWYTDPTVNALSGPGWEGNSNGWIRSTYKLCGLSNQQVRFRYVFASDHISTLDGISIDDFAIYAMPGIDLAVSDVYVNPVLNIGSVSDSVVVSVFNNGSVPLTSYTVSYQYNGTNQSVLVNDTLLAGGLKLVKLPGFTVIANSILCGNAFVASDPDLFNNTICDTVRGYALTPLNYLNNFETDTSYWRVLTVGLGTTRWQWGTPQYLTTTGAYSGNKCWDINLNQSYFVGANTILFSPVFNLTNATDPVIEFMLNYDTYQELAGVRLEYMHNGDNRWYVLGTNADTNALNWYNSFVSSFPYIPAWSGNSNGWKRGRYNLPDSLSSGIIQFRFIFTANTVDGTGFSLDDFSLHSDYANDLSVEYIKTPNDTNYTQQIPLVVVIKNCGYQTQTSFSAAYRLNNLTPVTSTWNGTLAPGDTIHYSFGNVSFPDGLSSLIVYTSGIPDQNNLNDTIRSNINTKFSYSSPYFNAFDNNNDGWAIDFGTLNTRWELGTPSYGNTNSAFSPPSCWDVDLASAYSNWSNALLYSPPININANNGVEISFRLNYNTELWNDGLTLCYSNDSITWYVLGTMNDPAGQNWYNSTVNGSYAWSGNSNGWKHVRYISNQFFDKDVIFLRWQFVSNASINMDGASIDDFEVRKIEHYDAAISQITSPVSNFSSLVPQDITVELLNKGTDPVIQLQVSYSLDNNLPVTQNWSGNLISNASTFISFPSQLFGAGQHTIKVWLTWGQDAYAGNDTLIYTFISVQPLTLPFNTGFDSGTDNFTVKTPGVSATNWEYGIPAFGSTSSSHSQPNCWDVNLSGSYSNLSKTYLVSPPLDFNNLTAISLSFWINFNSEIGADGMYVQYSTDEVNWNVLGSLNDPQGINWYNSTLFSTNPGWSGNSTGWTQVQLNASQLSGISACRIRFVFESDFNITNDGISLDDLSINATTGINEESKINFSLFPNPVEETLFLQQLPAGKQKIEIIDVTGQTIIRINNEEEKLSILCNDLKPGAYLIKLSGQHGESGFRKFIKL